MTTQEIWQGQVLAHPRISLEYARHLESRLAEQTRWRRLRGILGMSAASVLMLVNALTQQQGLPLMQACFIYGSIAMLIELQRWVRQTPSKTAPAEAGVLDSLNFYRRELERLRDAPKSAFRFSTLLGVPVLFLFVGSLAFERGSVGLEQIVAMMIVTLVVAAISAAAWWQHKVKFNREIAAVDLLLRGDTTITN